MLKRLTQWSPQKGMSRDQAVRYWREEHAQLVERVPGLRGYVQNVCLLGPDGRDSPYAGLGEAWFDDFESARVVASTDEWRAVLEDARTFMDLDQIAVAWAEENVVIPPSA